METKATTNLFRFTTFRAPQLVDIDRRVLGFIDHPYTAESHFLNGITGSTTLEDARDLVQTAASNFPAGEKFNSVEALKNYDRDLWEFSSRLMKSGNTLAVEADLAPPMDVLDPLAVPSAGTMKIRLWDNVYFDLVERKNRPVREVCLQMLIAINYLEKLDDQFASEAKVLKYVQYPKKPKEVPVDEKRALLLQRLANAAIIIHPAFTRYKEVSLGKLKAATKSLTYRKKRYKKQQERHDTELAKLTCDGKEALRGELLAFEKVYLKDYHSALDAETVLHDAQVLEVERIWIEANGELVARLKLENEINPDFDIVDYVPRVNYPRFSFTFDLPFSDTYSRDKLSQTALNWIAENKLETATITQAIAVIDSQCKADRKTAARIFRAGTTRGILNGVPFKNPSAELYDFAISINTIPVKTEERGLAEIQEGFYFSLILDHDDSYFVVASFELTVDGGTPLKDSKPKLLSNKNGRIFVSAFSKSALGIADNSLLTFKADVLLDNGVQLRIEREAVYIRQTISGTAQLVNGWTDTEPIHYGISTIGVADYRLVEQEVCCYIPGEVSHIENIMAREYREKSSRSLVRTERTTVETETKEVETITDNISTTRNEMSSEVAKVIQLDRATNIGVNAHINGETPGGTYSWGAGMRADFSFSRSTSDSNASAKKYAEDVTVRALERITQSVTTTRTSTIIREYEENNKHGYDNREGSEHVTGVYRWVDKVYTNRLINYGKRLMYEFMVPEPAKWYKIAIVVEAEESTVPGSGTGGTGQPGLQSPPVSLESEGIMGFEDIVEDNYVTIAALYGVTNLEPPKAPTTSTEKTIGGGEVGGNAESQTNSIQIPQDYSMSRLIYSGNADKRSNGHIKISGAGLYYEKTGGHGYFEINASKDFTNGPDGTVDIVVNLRKMRNWSVLIRANCVLKADVRESWQIATYGAIMDAYNAQLKAYNDAVAQAAAEAAVALQADDADAERNPRFNAQIINTELKRLCIEMMMAPFAYKQGSHDFYKEGECNVPILPSDKEMGNYKIQIEFFEQAFDWNIMSQIFYPYYWAMRCKWKELFQSTDSNDQGFQAFLQSGMAKIIVPIKPGYEAAVGFYMETGDIWTGSRMVINTDDENYLSLVDEMNTVEGFVEQEWQTTVPTTLTILQARSVLLDQGGLPCCETDTPQTIDEMLVEDGNKLKWLGLAQAEPEPTP